MILTLLGFLVLVPGAALCLLPMKNQFRFSPGRIVGGFAAAWLILCPACAYVAWRFLPGPYMLLTAAAVLFPLYLFCLRTHISKALAVYLITAAFLLLLSNAAQGYDALRNPGGGADIITKDFILCQMLLSFLSAGILSMPLARFGPRLTDRLNLPAVWYATLPLSAIFCVISLVLRPRKYETLYVNKVFFAFWVSHAMMAAAMLTLLIIFYCIVSSLLEAAETENQKRLLEMQKSQFLAQQRYMEATEKQRHDFRQSIRTMSALYDTGDYEGLGAYLHQYNASMPRAEMTSFCGDNALNALLNYYVHLASESGIEFDLRIGLPGALPISDVDVCGVVGNILENACTAAATAETPFIRLSILSEENGQLYIVTTNSFDGKVRKENGIYLSLDRKDAGMGLTSVRTTVERYGGIARFSHEGTEFHTDVMIPLPRDLPGRSEHAQIAF